MSRQRGVFITLEGVEGAGKSSNVPVIERWLKEAGYRVMTTREPGGTPLAEAIRKVMLAEWEEGMPPVSELLLVFAARAAHLEHCILPALDRGDWVLCDRFTDASFAYQGAGRGLGESIVSELQALVQGELRPDHVLIFDLPVEEGIQRTRGRGAGNRFDNETLGFLKRVRSSYRERADLNPERYHLIDSAGSPTAVAEQLEEVMNDIVSKHAT